MTALLDTGPKTDPSKVEIILPQEERAPGQAPAKPEPPAADDDLERQFRPK